MKKTNGLIEEEFCCDSCGQRCWLVEKRDGVQRVKVTGSGWELRVSAVPVGHNYDQSKAPENQRQEHRLLLCSACWRRTRAAMLPEEGSTP